MSDIRSRWVLTRGLIVSGGIPPRAIKACYSGATRSSEGLVRAMGMCQASMGNLYQYTLCKFSES